MLIRFGLYTNFTNTNSLVDFVNLDSWLSTDFATHSISDVAFSISRSRTSMARRITSRVTH